MYVCVRVRGRVYVCALLCCHVYVHVYVVWYCMRKLAQMWMPLYPVPNLK